MKSSFFLLAALTFATICFANEPPENSRLLVDDDFSREELGKGWTVQNGSWTITDGALRAMELEADNHAASARHVVETDNAVYQFAFLLGEDTEAFHFGFDPKRGSLDKKGHLFSVVVDGKGWKILKHLDKNKPKEDPNEVLASADHEFSRDRWYTMRVSTWGTSVKAMVEGVEPLEASHPTFGVPKPTLVFRVVGGPVEVDDVKVWVPAS